LNVHRTGRNEQGSAPRHCAGVVVTACTQGKRTQHGKPDSVVGRGDQPEAGDSQIGRYGVAERSVVPGNRVMPVEERGLSSRWALEVAKYGRLGQP